MSIIAVSQTLGSLGDEIGRELARTLTYQVADREIILEAAERFGEGVPALQHATEEKPTDRTYRCPARRVEMTMSNPGAGGSKRWESVPWMKEPCPWNRPI
jgi:cytidylate kinase-like protein